MRVFSHSFRFPRGLVFPEWADLEFELHRAPSVEVSLRPVMPGSNGGPAVLGGAVAIGRRTADLPPNILRLNLDAIAPQTEHVVTIVTVNEVVRLHRVHISHRDGGSIFGVGEYCGDGSALLSLNALPKGVVYALMGPKEYVEAMHLALEEMARDGDPTCRAKRFFFNLDYETHPMLWPLHEGASGFGHTDETFKSVAPYLAGRIRSRNDRVRRRRSVGLDAPTGAILEDILPFINLVRGLVETHFPGPGGEGIDIAALERAFLQFANGQLRFPLPDGMLTTQPSSGYLFLFAEFAIAAASVAKARGDHEDLSWWLPVAFAFLRAQPIFARAYPPSPEPASMASYQACLFRGSLPDDEVKRLLPPHAPETYESICELAAKHTSELLPAEI